MLTHSRLLSLLSYHGETGVFTWAESRSNVVRGASAGSLNKHNGYWYLRIDRKPYLAHRVAWFYTYGIWPSGQIDHVNCVRSDNRIANLRAATRNQNAHNASLRSDSTSGLKGVCWHKKNQKWYTHIQTDGKIRYLGSFETKEAAHIAYQRAADQSFGEFANYG